MPSSTVSFTTPSGSSLPKPRPRPNRKGCGYDACLEDTLGQCCALPTYPQRSNNQKIRSIGRIDESRLSANNPIASGTGPGGDIMSESGGESDLTGEQNQLVIHVDDLVQPRSEQIVRSRSAASTVSSPKHYRIMISSERKS